MPRPKPFQLLEINVISAQDLAPVSRSMSTYAVAWVHPERKLTTRVDKQGHTNPTWNDKFVFRVNDEFLEADNSAIMIEIYANAWLRDVRVGIVRVLISNLISASAKTQENSSMRFVALQIRRPSGRPQGILNMGISVLDSTMRSMPLYSQLSASAVGYHDLMDGKKTKHNPSHNKEDGQHSQQQQNGPKIMLRRTQSERTESTTKNYHPKAGSIVNPGGSIVNGSAYNGSIVNGSMLNGSMLNGSEIGGAKAPWGGSICSDVGPSPSVVAAAIAKGIYPRGINPRGNDAASLILDDWRVDGSVEGLKTKIERWRKELPPIYDRGSDYQKLQTNRSRHSRRHTDSGGLFSCFGNAYGCEFTIVCGADNNSKKKKFSKVHLSPSDDNVSHSFI